MYHYFYKITNNINGHFYYGVHNTDNLDDGYMGSGKRLHLAYKKYGMENFTKEILKFFDSSTEAFEYEAEVVNETLVEDHNCYNLALGGSFNTTGLFPAKDNKGNTYLINKNDPRFLSGELVSTSKYNVTVKDKNNKYMRVSIYDPRYLSGELVPIIHNKIIVKDISNKYYQVDKDDSRYLNGELVPLNKGNKHSQLTKIKISNSCKLLVGNKNSCYNKVWYYNDKIQKSKLFNKTDIIPDNWIKGRKLKF